MPDDQRLHNLHRHLIREPSDHHDREKSGEGDEIAVHMEKLADPGPGGEHVHGQSQHVATKRTLESVA